MYGGFTVLRTAVEEDIAPPAFDDLLGRAGRIRRRRLGLVLLATGLVVAAGLVLARPVHEIVRPGPAAAPTAGPPFEVADLVFTDARNGYVLLGPCTGQASCTTTRGLAGTHDGGRTWHRITLPVDVGSDASLLLDAHGTSVSVVLGDQRYVSGDSGRHWSRAHWLRDGRPIHSVPPGQSVTVFCPVDQARCEQRLAALDPVLGVQRPLAHQPELPPGTEGAASGLVIGDGDPLWVASRATHNDLWLAHSEDQGRTWQDLRGPTGHAWYRPSILPDPATGRAYLLDRSASSGMITAVWRLDDVRTGRWTALPAPGPAESAVRAQVMPNGELRYTGIAGHAWSTRHAGGQLHPATRALVDGGRVDVAVRQVVGDLVIGTPALGQRGDRVLFSTDSGQTWQVRPVQL